MSRKRAWIWSLPLVLGALAACDGRPKATPATGTDPEHQPHTGPAVAVFDLAGGAPEQPPTNFLGVASRKGSFDELVRQIERAGKDKDVKGALVRFGGASIGLARAMEIGDALAALKALKPVYCHADGYTNATLYASVRGCSKVFVSPAGDVEATGMAWQLVYMHKLLADYLGMQVDVLHVGRFKGTGEEFTRDGPSPEARASIEGTLADMRDAWLDGIKKSRPEIAEGAPEDGPYSPNAAKEAKLVDEIAYADEAKDALKKSVSAVRDDVRFGPGSTPGGSEDLGDLLRVLAGEGVGSAPVAVVRATGSISMAGGGGLPGSSGGITEKDLGKILQRVEHDDDVKALVLRIDSPGGSALASDLLWHALMRIRAKKPVVVSVGDMAASGGYYLASSGSVIFADATSIVGSIGVVSIKPALEGLLDKIGMHVETIPAKTGDAKAASRAAWGSVLTPWDDETREKVRETMSGIYDLFLSRVVEGRAGKITREALEQSAEGRIFSGREGKDRGLVDEIGGLQAAIARARDLAKLPPDARVTVLGDHKGLLDALGAGDDDGASESSADARAAETLAAAAAALRGKTAIDAAAELVPEVVPYVESLLPALGHERALCAVPYGIVQR